MKGNIFVAWPTFKNSIIDELWRVLKRIKKANCAQLVMKQVEDAFPWGYISHSPQL
jgi:hypothetical protein